MSSLDIFIVISWLTFTFAIGVFVGIRASIEGYWVNERSTSVLLLVLTVVSTQVGAGAIIGIASSTFTSGIGFGLVSLISTVVGFLMLAYFAPALKRFGDRHRAITLPELFRVRYGRSVQIASAAVILFTYVSLLAAQFRATGALLSLGTGIDLKAAIVFAMISVIVYSSFSGIRGDIVTDALHFGAMTIFLLLMSVFTSAKQPIEVWAARIPSEIWSPVSFAGYPFLVLGILFGAIIPLLQPELWVKIYASRTASEGRRVLLFSAILVIPFYIFAMYLGLLGSWLYTGGMEGDFVVFRLLSDFFPKGLFGFGLAGILAVILSTANTLIVILGATIFRDLLNIQSDEKTALRWSRYLAAASGTVAALMALAVPNLVQLLLNAFYMLLVLAPSLIGVCLWNRATSGGAAGSISIGALVTLAFLFILPRNAFLPGLLASILAFIIISVFTNHSTSEDKNALPLYD